MSEMAAAAAAAEEEEEEEGKEVAAGAARTFTRVCVVGGGHGGKTTALDLALQGLAVNLFEFPEWAAKALDPIKAMGNRLAGSYESVLAGTVQLGTVTDDLKVALVGCDLVIVCVQSVTLSTAARALVDTGLLGADLVVALNPGSTGGALVFTRIFNEREVASSKRPLLVEFGTLTYGTSAVGHLVSCSVKVQQVRYASLPMSRLSEVRGLEKLFPGLEAVEGSVLEAGLCNANVVVHPSITILNLGAMEREGAKRHLYRDGVSKSVASMIEKLDKERLALLSALGTPGVPLPVMARLQGFAKSEDYYLCYSRGFGAVLSPEVKEGHTLRNHRYFEEDVGLGLVLYCKLGEVLQVPTPAARATVAFASMLTGYDYVAENRHCLYRLGLDAMDPKHIAKFVRTGKHRTHHHKHRSSKREAMIMSPRAPVRDFPMSPHIHFSNLEVGPKTGASGPA